MTKSKELVSYSWKPLSPEASTFPHTHTHNILHEHREPSAHSRTSKPFRIAVAAHAEALQDIDDILMDDDSVDYSAPRQQPLEPQVQIHNNNQQVSDSDEANNSTPESATDGSLDTFSIEVIQPNEGLEIRLPINLPQRAPPNSPESPRTNVAVPIPDGLLTEDEETGDQAVPPTVVPTTQTQKVGKKLYLLHHRFHNLYVSYRITC